MLGKMPPSAQLCLVFPIYSSSASTGPRAHQSFRWHLGSQHPRKCTEL